MRKIIDNTNSKNDNPTVFPRGYVVDAAGSTPGTTGGEPMFGDMLQFFAKLAADSSITPNSLPDNETNGYQIFDALTAYIRLIDKESSAETWQTPTYESNFSAGTPTFQYRLNKGRLEFRGEISNTTGPFLAFNLPAAYRPANDVYVPFLQGADRDTHSTLLIESNGDVSSPDFSTSGTIVSYFNNSIILD